MPNVGIQLRLHNYTMKKIKLIAILVLAVNSILFAQNKELSETKLNQELISLLDTIYYYDQNLRIVWNEIDKKYGNNSKQADSIIRVVEKVDSINVIKVTKILDENGWLGEDVVGEKGNITLFLIIQHSNLETQLKYLPMFREAVKNGKAKPNQLALLEDRILMEQGKKQIYGSQLMWDQNTGKYIVYPIEDPDNVDKRRAEVGLKTLSEYLKNWDIIWDVEEHKRQNL